MSNFRKSLYVVFSIMLVVGTVSLVVGVIHNLSAAYADTTFSFTGKLVGEEDQVQSRIVHDDSVGDILVDEYFYLMTFVVLGKPDPIIIRYVQPNPPSYTLKMGVDYLVVVANGTYTLSPFGDHMYSVAISVKAIQ